MNGKLKIIVPLVLLLLAGGGYKFALAKPATGPKPKIEGSVYVLGKEFLVNLQDGRFAKLTVALVLDPKDTSTVVEGGEEGATAKPPDGFGPMGQEGVVRSIVTDVLSGAKDQDLISKSGRQELRDEILKQIHKKTDVNVDDVVFTDVTVQ